MKTLQTINTIELSNVCNLSCLYCVSRFLVKHPSRSPGIMSNEVFDQALVVLKRLCDQGTQAEVNVNGTGESCLDPQLPKRIRRVRDIMGERRVQFCTNGVNMTKVLAIKLRDSGINRIDISIHNPYYARKCAEIFKAVGVRGIWAMGALTSQHSWAGQLPVEDAPHEVSPMQCDPIIEGRGYVQKEGDITPCCFDYRLLGVFGTVFDDDILTRKVVPYELCKTCHQVLPDEKEKTA